MRRKRIIACIDFKDGQGVKGKKFKDIEAIGDPLELAISYESDGADELFFLDISPSRCKQTFELIKSIRNEISIPITFGGGISSLKDINAFLDIGIDKVSLGTVAYLNPNILVEASKEFGKDKLVVSCDVKKSVNGWELYIRGGRIATGENIIKWVQKVEEYGAGEILLTSMDADGMREGFDINLTKVVSETVDIPVIASGGVGRKEDFNEIFIKGGADAALGASVFHYNILKINEIKAYLQNEGIEVKI